jgi:hypothetical protein
MPQSVELVTQILTGGGVASRVTQTLAVRSRVTQTLAVWSRVIQTLAVWSRVTQALAVWSRVIQTLAVWSRVTQALAVWSRVTQTLAVWSRVTPICAQVVKHVVFEDPVLLSLSSALDSARLLSSLFILGRLCPCCWCQFASGLLLGCDAGQRSIRRSGVGNWAGKLVCSFLLLHTVFTHLGLQN